MEIELVVATLKNHKPLYSIKVLKFEPKKGLET